MAKTLERPPVPTPEPPPTAAERSTRIGWEVAGWIAVAAVLVAVALAGYGLLSGSGTEQAPAAVDYDYVDPALRHAQFWHEAERFRYIDPALRNLQRIHETSQ
jgi:hypothetical protein